MAEQDGTLAKRTAQFLAIRDRLKVMEEAHEEAKKPLLEVKAMLEGYFEKTLTAVGAQNIVTPLGTIHWNTKVTSALSDPGAFMDFVIKNQKFDLLERRASALAVKDYAGEHGELPPGCGLNTIRTIGVRKPGAKVKGDKW